MNRSSNLMQAAVVLNSLPKKQVASLLSRLEPCDIKTVLDAVKRLDVVSASQISDSLVRFSNEAERWRVGDSSKHDVQLENAQRSLEVALATPPSKLEKSVESSNPFEFLIDVIPMIRLHLLEDEHPKHVAMVLSTLPPDVASATMKDMDRALRVSVLKRMCELDELHEEDVAELSFALKLRLKKLLNSRKSKAPGVDLAANILSCSDDETRESLIAFMGQTDPDLANKLQRSVFKIERLETLEDLEIKTILKNVDTASWAPALKNSPMSLQTKIFANMAPRAAELLAQEMSDVGHVESVIEGLAQKNIVQVALKLAREGKIDLRKQRTPQPAGQVFPPIAIDSSTYAVSADPTSPIN